MNHRVKNSLAIVSSLLNLQARDSANPELADHLEEAANRVAAVARAHDQLSQASHVERMDIGKYVSAICKDLGEGVAQCEVVTDTVDGIVVSTDRAISIALIVNELIANAVKYAYADRTGGKIWVKVGWNNPKSFSISVRDEGAGLPADFNLKKSRGLGMRIVAAFATRCMQSWPFALTIWALSSPSRYRWSPFHDPTRPRRATDPLSAAVASK